MAKKEIKPAFVKRDVIVNGEKYRSFISSLKDKYRKSQIKAAVKVNTGMLEFYWEMGREISILKADAKWGSAFFDCVSLDMKAEFPGESGFSSSNIRYVYRWFNFYNPKFEEILKDTDEFLQRPVDEFLHQLGEEIQNKENLPNIIHHQLGDEFEMPIDFSLVPWKHHVVIFTNSNSIKEALFYIEETIKNSWSRKELEFAIEDGLYDKRGKALTNF